MDRGLHLRPHLGGERHVAFAIDVFSQKIVGWHAMTTKVTDLVLTCLRMVTWRRGYDGHPVGAELVHHSDVGSHDTSLRFTEHLVSEGFAPSTGSVGEAYDNTLMRSVISWYEAESIRRRPFRSGALRTTGNVEFSTATWAECRTNARLHSTLRRVAPAEHEHAHDAAITAPPGAAARTRRAANP